MWSVGQCGCMHIGLPNRPQQGFRHLVLAAYTQPDTPQPTLQVVEGGPMLGAWEALCRCSRARAH